MIHVLSAGSVVPPPSARPPDHNLAPRDVEALADELVAYHAHFAPLFQRSEQRSWALAYLQGQLLDLDRKSIEPMALALEGGGDYAGARCGVEITRSGQLPVTPEGAHRFENGAFAGKRRALDRLVKREPLGIVDFGFLRNELTTLVAQQVAIDKLLDPATTRPEPVFDRFQELHDLAIDAGFLDDFAAGGIFGMFVRADVSFG